MLFGITFSVFKYRIKNIEQKNKLLNEKIKIEKELHQSTLASIKSQMNPHFIFNALNTIQSYIYLNDKKAASNYLVNFSELTRHILEMSSKDKISLQEEIRALELYLNLEKMRFEDDFSFELTLLNITSEQIMIPSMLIQPYVENAVKHGLLHKKGMKILKITFKEEANNLIVTVYDNGIGIEKSKEINAQRHKQHHSFATNANQKRFELLNKNSTGNIGVAVNNLKNDNSHSLGTEIQLTIPF